MSRSRGNEGWDDYAAFYDWENARTFGRRDIPFWRRCIECERGPVLELGCGTGRVTRPLARSGAYIFGIDRSRPMLDLARRRARRAPRGARPYFIHGDVGTLPFRDRTFGVILAPYGLLQSLIRTSDLDRTLKEASRALRPGGLMGIELVPELPAWAEHGPRVALRGARDGGTLTLVESVRQDRRRRLTIFDEQFIERRGAHERRTAFSLVFRTRPMREMLSRLEQVGLEAEAILGDYDGGRWHARAETWLILGRKGPRP